ncbi:MULTISPECIES: DUF2634 domain-containing protein [Lysinibacillus]|uniref:DUF2634 domain-containing protein n=1 Tax=Lysinibacillus TaxID=400634 RepID=UPI00214BB9AB|nr:MULTISPECIES: DUF2634 domain-containing protein [Lysinibacillus]UUV26109.1 DUF2634 domain-containing protein [Lysinibacillus sp. FN11]UYB48982.1 DUF2634 domain-containing protein [Lysinibacillus capsici]
MIPQNILDEELTADFEEVVQPSRTYKLDLERKRIVGYCDGREAIEQAIYKALSTERYDHLIYTWNYGAEIAKLFGQPIPYVYSELKRLITEALTHDDRIDSVDAFSFSHVKNKVHVQFTAHTIAGEIEITKEVAVS